MYSFKTILIWEELRKLLLVHAEYLIIMLINDLAFWGYGNLFLVTPFCRTLLLHFFNIFIIRFIRTVFRKNLEKELVDNRDRKYC